MSSKMHFSSSNKAIADGEIAIEQKKPLVLCIFWVFVDAQDAEDLGIWGSPPKGRGALNVPLLLTLTDHPPQIRNWKKYTKTHKYTNKNTQINTNTNT